MELRVLIVYSANGNLEDLVQGIKDGMEGVAVDTLEAEAGNRPVPVGAYDMICVGSPVEGFFGGQVAADIDDVLKRCTRMDGKKGAVFVKPKVFGTGKAMKQMMGMLERQGVWVEDFAALGTVQAASEFGTRLLRLLES